MESTLAIFGLTTLGSLLGLLGGILLLFKKGWSRGISVHSIPFAAGVMLAVSFLDILPEAARGAGVEGILGTVLIVIVVAFFFEQFFVHLHHHGEHKRTLASSMPMVVAGDTVHNFFDGIAIAAAYLASPALGVIVAVSTFLHELPHEMGDFGLMLAAGWSRIRIIFINIISALSSYLGALFVILFSSQTEQSLSILLGVAGGLFIYVAASDLLPEIQEDQKDKPWHQAGLLLAGVLVIWVLTKLVPV